MELIEQWDEVKRVFRASFKSSLHYSIATVSESGEPHVTPIGSLILTTPGRGFYFEQFTSAMPGNLAAHREVCVMAVNSGLWFWLRSLMGGQFVASPGLRLYGTVGEARPATETEKARWLRRVRMLRFTRGHRLMWRNMNRVREIQFTRAEPVTIGRMTQGL